MPVTLLLVTTTTKTTLVLLCRRHPAWDKRDHRTNTSQDHLPSNEGSKRRYLTVNWDSNGGRDDDA